MARSPLLQQVSLALCRLSRLILCRHHGNRPRRQPRDDTAVSEGLSRFLRCCNFQCSSIFTKRPLTRFPCTATAMTAATNVLPSWLSYRASAPSGATYRQQIGLHRSCTSEFSSSNYSSPHHSRGWECHAFPTRDDCHGDERYFCSMWRSTGFLMAFALVTELASLVSFLVILSGGKYMRETGWKVLSGLLGLVSVVHIVALSIAVCYVPLLGMSLSPSSCLC